MTSFKDTTFKKVVFYFRVSTNSQDLELQIKSASRFLEQFPDGEIVIINEFGVSSNKLSMQQRKHLLELVEMIKRDEIHTLFVYDRSRLTRRFYEYFHLYSLLWEHNVTVVFTTTDSSYPPFSQDIVTEGINALLTEEEGKNISRRSKDVFKKVPNRKFGYILEKGENARNYFFDPEFQGDILAFFDALKTISSLEELFQAATILKKVSKREYKLIFSLITDPFYCGHERSNDKLYPLPYVMPYITKKEFEENFSKFNPMLKQLTLNQTELELQNAFSIKCGKCGEKLKYSYDAISNEAHYECKCASNKNKRVRYDVQEIKKVVTATVHNYFHHIDSHYLESVSIQALKRIENKLLEERNKLASELKEKEVTLALADLARIHPNSIKVELSSIKQLKTDCIAINTDISLCSFAQSQIHEHVRIIKNQLVETLSEDDLISLASSIIDEIIAYPDKIEMIQFFNEGIHLEETIQVIEVKKE